MASESRSSSQEKPQDSRDEILKAAIRLFARRGFHETSMSEVAREAHVSKALIFWHFKTKEELFLAVLNRLLEPYFIDFAEEAGRWTSARRLRRLVESYLLFVRDNASSVRFFLGQLLHGEKVPDELSDAGAEALRRISRNADRYRSPRAGQGIFARATSRPRPPPASWCRR